MYDGTTVHLSTADRPDTVIARADTCGFVTGSWEVTAYTASLASVMAWMRMLDGEDLIDVAPFWASAPVVLALATGGQVGAWPVIACPTAPSSKPSTTTNNSSMATSVAVPLRLDAEYCLGQALVNFHRNAGLPASSLNTMRPLRRTTVPSSTARRARAPTSAFPRPAGSWPSWPAVTRTAPGTGACAGRYAT
ncbi:hypothetical protein OK006_9598 [Actinobacteria bacterium OK006]|nr:hypothetical protein OK006_9598 [Actinobacteria bacterium OK006]